jgi:hypothetical protein
VLSGQTSSSTVVTYAYSSLLLRYDSRDPEPPSTA